MTRPLAPTSAESSQSAPDGTLGTAQLGQVLDSSSVVIAVKDLDGRYVYVNRPFAKLLDGNPAQFIGRTDADLFPEPLARRLRGNDHRVLADGRSRSFEERMEIHGQAMIFDTRKFPLRDESGKITGLCLMASNVTTQRRTERALETIALSVSAATGSEVFDLIVKSLASALEVDFAFIARVTEIEPRTLQALSAWYRGKPVAPPRYRAAGTPCDDVLGCGYTWISSDLQSRYPGDDMVFEFDFRSYAGYPLSDGDGNFIGVLSVCHSGPMPEPGLVEHLLRIFSVRATAELARADAERRRTQLEAQLRQAQKMEAIGHLAGGIAHDFNNILTGVVGYLGLARQRLQDADATVQDYLAQATDSAGRATDLVRQLLTFSRGHGGGRPEAVDMRRVLRRCTPLLHSTLSSSVELEVEASEALPAVWMDPVQIEQILLNLCINARDAMEGRGRIRIRLDAVRVRGQYCSACQKAIQGEHVELEVSDSGRGIDAAIMDRIFEPFYSTKPPGKGSGMGLAIVHGIVHEHGGHIRVVSEPDTGTTFRILLPAYRGRTETLPESLPEPVPAGDLHGRIVVVDDEPVVGSYMTALLSQFGLEARHFDNPREALDAIASMQPAPDCVIADYTMPEIDGLEFIARLRRVIPGLPALLYSGYTEQVDQTRVRELALGDVLQKPVDPAILHESLRSLLAGGARKND